MDIVERLKIKGPRPMACDGPVVVNSPNNVNNSGFNAYNKIDDERVEAADKITALKAESEKLREALEAIIKIKYDEDDYADTEHAFNAIEMIAKAALQRDE